MSVLQTWRQRRRLVSAAGQPIKGLIWAVLAGAGWFGFGYGPLPAKAQSDGIEIRGAIDDVPKLRDRNLPQAQTRGFNTTVVPRQRQPADDGRDDQPARGRVTFRARLVEDSPLISKPLTWRIFKRGETATSAPVLLQTIEQPAVTIPLAPGTYYVNAAFGRANLTKRITVLQRGILREDFILNAGGLIADVQMKGGGKPPAQNVSIDVYSEDSDQSGKRKKIVSGARPGQVIRLNSGIYQLQSRIGNANAYVRSEISVEAGKLTQATIRHDAAIVTFKLVTAPGGEAIAGTRWAILSTSGDVVQESVGALPRHFLAPGGYTVAATNRGATYRRDFEVVSGNSVAVEVVAD